MVFFLLAVRLAIINNFFFYDWYVVEYFLRWLSFIQKIVSWGFQNIPVFSKTKFKTCFRLSKEFANLTFVLYTFLFKAQKNFLLSKKS